MPATLRPAVFLDRDGTLNEMVYDETHGVMDSPFRPEHVVLVRQAGTFVRALNDIGLLAIVVTNQPGLAKGTLTPLRLDRIHERLRAELAVSGGQLDGIYFCPHHPDYGGRCACRKPEPGLVLRAAEDHRVDLRRSFLVGDGLNDVQAGRAAGVTTILVSPLKAEIVAQMAARPDMRPDHAVKDLHEALAVIRAAREEMIAGRG